MTPDETQFFTELFALLRKYDGKLTFLPKNAVPFTMPGRATPKFLVHMIGFQNLALSKMCIESVLGHTAQGKYHFRLTNNGSTDGTKDYFDQIASQFKHVTVNHESENTFFQEPNEKAFALAKEMGCEFLVLLNNDAVCPPGWLDTLEATMDGDPKIAIAGPFGGCSRVNSDMNGCDDTKLEFCEFSCAAVRLSAITTPKLFAPFLSQIYGEDLECCLRLQYQGWKIARSPFRILHKGSKTAGDHPQAKAACAAANARNLAEMRKRYAHWNKVRRFDHPIIVRRRFAVGDVLLTTPIIAALKRKYALCPIYVETDYPDIFAGNPNVERAMVKVPVTDVTFKDAMVIELDGSYERTPGRHVLESYAEAAGLEMREVVPKLHTYFPAGGNPAFYQKWCAVHVGPTTWAGKNWPIERWNEVIQLIRKRGYKVMVFGNPPRDATILCDEDQRGQSGIKQFAQLMSRCSLFVGLDSFPAHLAASLDIPAVVLYGVTDPKCFAVSTAKYIPVTSDKTHPDTGRRNREANVTFIETTDAVMRTISIYDVMTAVDEIIKPT